MLADGARFDVVVAGAGPAGSMAALRAASKGASTLLLEKRPAIGSPVRCAEGITSEMLDACGLRLRDEWVGRPLRMARIFSPSGVCVKVDPGESGRPCGYMLDRERFDLGLAMDAAENGARVLAGTPVTGIARAGEDWAVEVRSGGAKRTVRSHIVIAADGFESQVARWAGRDVLPAPRDTMSCAEFTLDRIEGEPDAFEFHVDNLLTPGGYAWVFWKGEGIANVGVGIRGDRLDHPGMPLRALERFIASKPGLARGRRLRAISGGVPVAMPPRSNAKDGLFLAGDAARVCDPLHGGGISNAVLTGAMAGEAASRILYGMSPEEAGQEYDRSWHERFDSELKLAYALKEFLGATPNDRLDEFLGRLAGIRFDRLDLRSMTEKVIAEHPQLGPLLR